MQIRKPDDSVVEIDVNSLSATDREWVTENENRVRRLNLQHPGVLEAQVSAPEEVGLLLAQAEQGRGAKAEGAPSMALAFDAFVKANAIRTRWDRDFFYVESNGIPDHRMMVGITAWQQQVPLPQKYFGDKRLAHSA